MLVTGSGDRPQDRGVTERQSSVRQIPGRGGVRSERCGDVAVILDGINDDVDWAAETSSTAAPWYGVRHGKEAVEDFFAAFGSAMEVEEFTPVSLLTSSDSVTARSPTTAVLRTPSRPRLPCGTDPAACTRPPA